ncbi:MAG: hypothetical protein AAFU34_19940 [Pseudomonadota bacterium]
MDDIRVAFWNLQNLFDSVPSEIAADLEFTPEKGWTEEAVENKLNVLIEGVATMFDGQGPDLFGICEIENRGLIERFVDLLNARLGRTDYTFAHEEAADLRGIDCSLIYSEDIFELAGEPEAHLVFLRFRTRDIFEVPLRVKESGAELVVFVNHWPSRSRNAVESEPYRITVASHLARRVDANLKLSRDEVVAAAADLGSIYEEMKTSWNRNVLILGDMNDDPFNRSVLDELTATNSLDKLEEELPEPGSSADAIETYLRRKAVLYNLSWKSVGVPGEGTIFFSRNTVRTKQIFDQIIVSRGLLLGQQGLSVDLDSWSIHTPTVLLTNTGLPADAALHRVRPKKFEPPNGRGASDHFPVLCKLRTAGA